MEVAGWQGHLDAVRYLDENTYQRASSWGFATAAKRGWLNAQLALMQHYHHREGTMDAIRVGPLTRHWPSYLLRMRRLLYLCCGLKLWNR
jgi:hypothetical protein